MSLNVKDLMQKVKNDKLFTSLKPKKRIKFRLFSFDYFISSFLIKILYVLGALALTGGGLVTMFADDDGVIFGLLAATLGNVVWRIICEAMIVLFSIHDLTFQILSELRK